MRSPVSSIWASPTPLQHVKGSTTITMPQQHDLSPAPSPPVRDGAPLPAPVPSTPLSTLVNYGGPPPAKYDHFQYQQEDASQQRRPYSTTSDIRGTLEPLDQQWLQAAPTLRDQVFPPTRRESEPAPYHQPFGASQPPYFNHGQRHSLSQLSTHPHARDNGVYLRSLHTTALPSSQPMSPSLSTPSLASNSSRDSRSSYSDSPYMCPSPLEGGDPRFHGDSPVIRNDGAYPFPDSHYQSPRASPLSPMDQLPPSHLSDPANRKRAAGYDYDPLPLDSRRSQSPLATFNDFNNHRPRYVLPVHPVHQLTPPLPFVALDPVEPSETHFNYSPQQRSPYAASLQQTTIQMGGDDAKGGATKKRRVEPSRSLPSPQQEYHRQIEYDDRSAPDYHNLASSSDYDTAPALQLFNMHQLSLQNESRPFYNGVPTDSPEFNSNNQPRRVGHSAPRSHGTLLDSPHSRHSPPSFASSPVLDSPLPVHRPTAPPASYPGDDVSVCHMSPPTADFEAQGDAKPRQQKLRFEEDQYTPLWVRHQGHSKEGWCALCPNGGKWLQLKNSAYWYHRQFQHGVSSVSGHYFLPPIETRPTEGGEKTEGLCHSCGDWAPYQNHKSGGSQFRGPTLWFRHSHSCHTYFSPKREARKAAKSTSD